MLIDNNCIAQASDSWLEYTLVKELRRRLGSCTIHHLILLQPSVRLLKNMHSLQNLLHLESVYLPTWEGKLKKHQWRYFFDLKRSLSTHSGTLIRVQHPCMISLEEGSYLMIEPQKTMLKTGAISYSAIKVYGRLNKQEVTILSEKAFTKK
jgi:hypothetical protein